MSFDSISAGPSSIVESNWQHRPNTNANAKHMQFNLFFIKFTKVHHTKHSHFIIYLDANKSFPAHVALDLRCMSKSLRFPFSRKCQTVPRQQLWLLQITEKCAHFDDSIHHIFIPFSLQWTKKMNCETCSLGILADVLVSHTRINKKICN